MNTFEIMQYFYIFILYIVREHKSNKIGIKKSVFKGKS